jgi:hypothetical protein
MSKLPTDFVKAPTPQPKRARRTRKASLIAAEPVQDPTEIVLHLTDDELAALEEARQALREAGSEVTLDQMIHRVFAEWMVRVRAAVMPQARVEARADATQMHARLRDFIAAPIKVWRELAKQMWRESVARSWRRAS